MNRYITISGHILELPIVLGIVVLIAVSVIIVVVFFYGINLRKPAFRRTLLSLLVIIVLGSVSWGLIYNDSLKPEHVPRSIEALQNNNLLQHFDSSDQKQVKFRYTKSHNLEKLGFINTIFDDGFNTYFYLNTVTVPKILIEDVNGELVDQKDHVEVKNVSDHPFPVLVIDQLSSVWYLQFNEFVSHVSQNPVFKPSYDTNSVKVYYSDLYFTTVKLLKDTFICDQASSDEPGASLPRIRHYFVFDDLRYYIDDCFTDFSAQSKK